MNHKSYSEILKDPSTVSNSYFSDCMSNSCMVVISVVCMNCGLQRDMQFSSGMSGFWAHHSVFFLALALSYVLDRMQSDALENKSLKPRKY